MKKLLCIILCLALLLTGCGNNKQESEPEQTQPTQPPTEEPTVGETQQENTMGATVLADGTRFVLELAARESVVQIVGDYDENHYMVKTDAGYGVIEKCLVQLEGEEPYASWTGYAVTDGRLYNNYQMMPEKVWILTWGTELKVLADLGDRLVVTCGERTGYMRKSHVKTSYYGSAEKEQSTYLSDVTPMTRMEQVPQEGAVTKTGTVLVDNAEIMLATFIREDEVQIVLEDSGVEGWYRASLNGQKGYVRKNLVATADQERYTQWRGYTCLNADVYDNYYLTGEPETELLLNTEVQVLADLDNCYLVFDGDDLGFMRKDQISRNWILADLLVNTLPEIEEYPDFEEGSGTDDEETEGDDTEGEGGEGEGGEGEGGEGEGGEGEGGESGGGESGGGESGGGESGGGESGGGESGGGESGGGESGGGESGGGESGGGESGGGESGGGESGGGESGGGGSGGGESGGGESGGGESGGGSSGGETPPAPTPDPAPSPDPAA